MKDVILLSGGYDSSVLLEHLKQDLHKEPLVYHAYISYNHTHYNQMESALIKEVPDYFSMQSICKEEESEYIPCRNSILIFDCINSIIGKGVQEPLSLYVGFIKNFPCFPDANKEWLERLNFLLDLEFEGKVKVYAPFIDKTKDEVFRMGCRLGVKLEETFSCNFEKDGKACGKCSNCTWRAKHKYPFYGGRQI